MVCSRTWKNRWPRKRGQAKLWRRKPWEEKIHFISSGLLWKRWEQGRLECQSVVAAWVMDCLLARPLICSQQHNLSCFLLESVLWKFFSVQKQEEKCSFCPGNFSGGCGLWWRMLNLPAEGSKAVSRSPNSAPALAEGQGWAPLSNPKEAKHNGSPRGRGWPVRGVSSWCTTSWMLFKFCCIWARKAECSHHVGLTLAHPPRVWRAWCKYAASALSASCHHRAVVLSCFKCTNSVPSAC